MTLQGVDGLDLPSGAALRAAGRVFACSYTKSLTAAKVADLKANGIEIVVIWETTGTDFTGGAGQGLGDAQNADAACKALGLSGAPVYFAIDTATTDYAAVNLYLAGCAAGIGKARVGVYGDYNVVTQAMVAQACGYYWQTYAWSGGALQGNCHLYQYLNGQKIDGAGVDFTRTVISDTNYGQASTAPAPAPSTGAPDMFWIKDPGSPACYTFGGGYKCPIPDDPDLNDLIKAQVPELTGISQTYFNLIPIAGAAPPAPAPPAAPFVSLTLEGTMEDAGGGKFTFTGTGTPEG